MDKKEKVALLIGLKDQVNQDMSIKKELKNKVSIALTSAINESVQKEIDGLALNTIIGKVVTDLNLLLAFEGLKLNDPAKHYWDKLVEIDTARRQDLLNSSFILGGISSLH